MLICSAAQEQAPLLVLPLVLEEEATDVHVLLEIAVVTEDYVFQTVIVVLCTESQVGGHEEQFLKRVDVLRPCDVCEVVSVAVCLCSGLYVFFGSLSDAAIIAPS